MGFVASQARLLFLTARRSDLEFQAQLITQRRMMLASLMMNVQQPLLMGNNDPRSPLVQRIEALMERFNQIDKMLEMQMKQVDTQQQAINTEIESVQKIITRHAQQDFKLQA